MRAYADLVVAAVLPRRRSDGTLQSHLDYVMGQRVDQTYFQGAHRWLWQCAVDASLLSEGALDETMVAALLEGWRAPDDERQKTVLLYLDLRQEEVSRDKIKIVLPRFIEEVHADRFATTLEESVQILTDGLRVGRDEELRGYRDAKRHLVQKVAELENGEASQGLPTQEIREAVTEVLEEYAAAKTTDQFGVLTGFRALDELTRGIQRGELWIFCGYPGEGKSQLLLNCAYHACVQQAKTVVYVSLEMPVPQVRRRLYVRHTNHPSVGVPGGLLYKRVKEGALNIDEEKIWLACCNDFASNAAYGKLHVMQVGKSETVASLRERLTYLRARGPIDLVVLDYASLLGSARKRHNRQDEIVEVIEALKALALTFNEGEGLAILTANQVSRNAKEEADKNGRYGINFAAETSAIEKNADLLGWILRNEELKANHEAKIGISKYRDGDTLEEFVVVERFASGLLADLDDADVQVRF